VSFPVLNDSDVGPWQRCCVVFLIPVSGKMNNGSLLDVQDRGVADCWHEPPGTKKVECTLVNEAQNLTFTMKPLLYCTGEQYGSNFTVS
jgi:hypothetical protein